MLVLYQLFLCFVYTLRYFYTFSGTNLLTRCRSASCLFSAIFGFRKASKEIFSKLDGTKSKVKFLPERTQRPKGSRRGATRWPHPRAAQSRGPRRHQVWAPGAPSYLASSPIKS